MEVTVEKTDLEGVLLLTHQVFEDDRGFFYEAYRQDVFEAAGLPGEFVQLNHSRSVRNVVRGLHFQWHPPMGKVIRVTLGSCFVVAVDIRRGSPTLGKWVGVECSAENRKQMFAPAGCARGFAVLSEVAEVNYLCTGTYNGACESGFLWNDPDVGVKWPCGSPLLSRRDSQAQTFAQWMSSPESHHFRYERQSPI